MISIAPLVALGTLVFTFVNFLKYLSGRDWSSALTQLIAWGSGIGAVLLFAHTGFAHGLIINNTPVDRLNWASLILVGLLATSLLSTFNEGLKAIDRTQSAAKPDLLTGRRYVTTVAAEPIKGGLAEVVATPVTPPPHADVPPHRTV